MLVLRRINALYKLKNIPHKKLCISWLTRNETLDSVYPAVVVFSHTTKDEKTAYSDAFKTKKSNLAKLRKLLKKSDARTLIFAAYESCDPTTLSNEDFIKVLLAVTNKKSISLQSSTLKPYLQPTLPIKVLSTMAELSQACPTRAKWDIPFQVWDQLFCYFDLMREAGNMRFLLGCVLQTNYPELKKHFQTMVYSASKLAPLWAALSVPGHPIFCGVMITPTMLTCYLKQHNPSAYFSSMYDMKPEMRIRAAVGLCKDILPMSESTFQPNPYLTILELLHQDYPNQPQLFQRGFNFLIESISLLPTQPSPLFDTDFLNAIYSKLSYHKLNHTLYQFNMFILSEEFPYSKFRPDIQLVNKYILSSLIPRRSTMRQILTGLDSIQVRWLIKPNLDTLAYCLRNVLRFKGRRSIKTLTDWFVVSYKYPAVTLNGGGIGWPHGLLNILSLEEICLVNNAHIKGVTRKGILLPAIPLPVPYNNSPTPSHPEVKSKFG